MVVDFQQVQRQFAAHIRDPHHVAIPDGVEPRRMQIYNDLFFNNIEGFAAGAFPVFKSLLDESDWRCLVREFLVEYRCKTPYFLEISQEFMRFLGDYSGAIALPAFTRELTHYEWVELALDVADVDPDFSCIDANGDMLSGVIVVSPVAWPLAYRYPVHLIGREYQPEQPLDNPCYLVVYRDRADSVRFMEVNAVTSRLLELLRSKPDATGSEVLDCLAVEIGFSDRAALQQFGLQLLQQLQADGLVLGVLLNN